MAPRPVGNPGWISCPWILIVFSDNGPCARREGRKQKTNRRLNTWARLLRLPNLLTTPGDPLAGFLLAGGADWRQAVAPAAAGVLLYASGLLLNDWADAALDARERPERPIPSGRVSRGGVLAAAAAAAALGVAAAFGAGLRCGAAAVLLLGLIGAYDLLVKRSRPAGSVNMGLCRGVSLLMGAGAAGSAAAAPLSVPLSVWIAAAVLAGYVASFALVAAGEHAEQRLGWWAALPGLWLIGGLAGLSMAVTITPWSVSIGAGAALNALAVGGRVARAGPPAAVQRAVGQWIRNLLPVQAAFCAACGSDGGLLAAIVLLALWPISAGLGRRFAGS